MRTATLFLLAFLAGPALAQTDPSLVGNCAPRTAGALLDINNVRAQILNGAELFHEFGASLPETGLEIPIDSGIRIHAGDNLWLGGIVNGEVRTSGSSFGPFEMWPGPIPSTGTPPVDCSAYDRFWSLNRATDLSDFNLNESPTAAESQWPVDLGAPFIDVDGQPGYHPSTGDKPLMLGDQMHWWVMNDVGNEHAFSHSNPLGVEVASAAFAFKNNHSLQETIFLRHTVTNKGASTISDLHIGRFLDVDLGSGFDDYVGTDSTISLFYFYNSDNSDGQYGDAPPALGLMILEASHARGGLPTDTQASTGGFMTHSIHLNKGQSAVAPDPADKQSIYNYLRGLNLSGTSIVEGGAGFNTEGLPTKFAFPGDPVSGTYWSDVNSDGNGTSNSAWDRRGAASFGPFNLEPGDSATFTFAYLWARGTSNLDSITKLRSLAQTIHSSSAAIVGGANLDNMSTLVEQDPVAQPQDSFWLNAPFPNPSNGRVTVKFSLSLNGPTEMAVFDVLSRKVATLYTGIQTAGPHEASFDTSRLRPGVYTIRLQSNRNSTSRLLTVIR
jgi:hypothetical protein